MVGGYQGDSVVLECIVEAWPAPVNYWEKEGRLVDEGDGRRLRQQEMGKVYRLIISSH